MLARKIIFNMWEEYLKERNRNAGLSNSDLKSFVTTIENSLTELGATTFIDHRDRSDEKFIERIATRTYLDIGSGIKEKPELSQVNISEEKFGIRIETRVLILKQP